MFSKTSNLSSCTFSQTGKSLHRQYWKRCLDCFPSTEEGACLNCIAVCHQGHNVEHEVRSGDFYCDCGSKGAPTCKLLCEMQIPEFPVKPNPHPHPIPFPDNYPFRPNPFTDRPPRFPGHPPHQYTIPQPLRPGSMGPNTPGFIDTDPSYHPSPSMGNLPAFFSPPPWKYGSGNGVVQPKGVSSSPFSDWTEEGSAFTPVKKSSHPPPPPDYGSSDGPTEAF